MYEATNFLDLNNMFRENLLFLERVNQKVNAFSLLETFCFSHFSPGTNIQALSLSLSLYNFLNPITLIPPFIYPMYQNS